jgi:ketosteroid isomerase-like protein
MAEQENLATVEGIYAAFGRADLAGIVDQVAEDVVWHDPGPSEVPHAGTYTGRDGVARFFATLGETVAVEDFAPEEFVAEGDRVVVLGRMRARVKETGRAYDSDWAMVWTFRDGKVARFRVYEDTAAEAAAHTSS